nr:glycosyltransferase family 1 protein [uncultured Bacteroides sp.]
MIENKKIRVLFFIDRLRLGGIQALTYDIIKHNDNQRMQIDILNLDDGEEYPLTKTLKNMGITVYQLKNTWIRTPLDCPHYFRQVDKFFKEHHNYDVVHMHSSSKNYYILKAAKKYGIPVRVAHSHNTSFQTHNPLSIALGNLMKHSLRKHATHCCGCSNLACEWLFGKECVKQGYAQVILNAIDSKPFIYNEKTRQEVRKELGIEDKFVIGHVGRLERQKNHAFLIDIFAEITKFKKNACLVLVGTGSLQLILEQKITALGLTDKVVFLGFRDDRNRIMQAMDSFVFPSLYEGLSVVLIEAQTSGLPVFISDSTTTEVSFSPEIKFMSLQQSPQEWAKAIMEKGQIKRKDMTKEVQKAGFEMQNLIDNLYKLYTEK